MRCSFIRSRWSRQSTATPLPAAACWFAVPTGALWRVAGGRIGVTELLVGVPFPALTFEAVRFAVPRRHLSEFMFGGATYDVDAALERGWVDEVVEADALMDRAVFAAQELARLSPATFTQTKRQLRQDIAERIERNGATTDKIVTEIWTQALDHVRDYVARTLKKS